MKTSLCDFDSNQASGLINREDTATETIYSADDDDRYVYEEEKRKGKVDDGRGRSWIYIIRKEEEGIETMINEEG